MGGHIQTTFNHPTTWLGFDTWLGKREKKRLGFETWCYRLYAESISIEHHGTAIVTYAKDGNITLDNGGWYSLTTKQRMEQFSPFGIWSTQGEWEVHRAGLTLPFERGMVFYPDNHKTQTKWLQRQIDAAELELDASLRGINISWWHALDRLLKSALLLDFWKWRLALHENRIEPQRFFFHKKHFHIIYNSGYWEDLKIQYGIPALKEMLRERFTNANG